MIDASESDCRLISDMLTRAEYKPTGILTRELRSDYFYDFHIYSRAVSFGAVGLG